MPTKEKKVMFGRHFGPSHEGQGGGRRGWREHSGHGHGHGGRHGKVRGLLRMRRMLAQGDLKLIALALIAEQPRHGYEIIKQLEDKTAGWYSPSPGIVYPTLTYLEEAGYVTAQADGAKRLYTITEEGRAYLAENQDFVSAVLERLAGIGERIARMRRRFGDDEEDDSVPPLVRAALDNLRDATRKRLDGDDAAEPKVVEIL